MATKKVSKTSSSKQSKTRSNSVQQAKSGKSKAAAPVSKAEKKAVSKKISAIEKKHKAVDSAQKTIPYLEMFKNGVCHISDDYYTKTICFNDINYQLAPLEDQQLIFQHFCDIHNYFDDSLTIQFTYMNVADDAETYKSCIHIEEQDDDFNHIRREFTEMLKDQLEKGNSGLIRLKYLTFGIHEKEKKQAISRLEQLEGELVANFKHMGVQAYGLDGAERLQVLHRAFNPSASDKFVFDWHKRAQTGLSTKDFIAPPSFNFGRKNMFQMGNVLGATYYINVLRNAMQISQDMQSHLEGKQFLFEMAYDKFNFSIVKMKEQEYEGKMPDKTVTLTQMVEYGYHFNLKNEMLPLDTEKAVQLFDIGAEVYRLYEDNTEGLVESKAEIAEHSGLFGIEKADWERVQPFAEHMDKILAEQPKREEFLLHGNVPAAGIYQLKENNDTRNLTYLNSKYLEEKGLVPDRENYNLVYSFEVVADDLNNKNAFLNKVYEKFNNDHPEDYLGRSLCVSDVVVIHNGEDLSAHYVDSFGFKELENFGEVHREIPKQEKSEVKQEQPTQTAEKTAKPKAKSKSKAKEEKKPSVLGAIEELKKNSPKQSNETNEKVNEKGVEL